MLWPRFCLWVCYLLPIYSGIEMFVARALLPFTLRTLPHGTFVFEAICAFSLQIVPNRSVSICASCHGGISMQLRIIERITFKMTMPAWRDCTRQSENKDEYCNLLGFHFCVTGQTAPRQSRSSPYNWHFIIDTRAINRKHDQLSLPTLVIILSVG